MCVACGWEESAAERPLVFGGVTNFASDARALISRISARPLLLLSQSSCEARGKHRPQRDKEVRTRHVVRRFIKPPPPPAPDVEHPHERASEVEHLIMQTVTAILLLVLISLRALPVPQRHTRSSPLDSNGMAPSRQRLLDDSVQRKGVA